MLRTVLSRVLQAPLKEAVLQTKYGNICRAIPAVVQQKCFSSKHTETDEQFDARYEAYFNRPDIDGWEIRKAMNDLAGMDLVPEPRIIIAALKAARRLNDYAVAVRFLEVLKEKGDAADKNIYPYILQEIQSTLDELGIDTPEKLGYDKPELALESVWHMH